MNVLIVDDELLVREALSDFIEDQLGHSVTQSESAYCALEEMARRHYDLILTDIRMPGMDGIDLVRRIRMVNPDNHTAVIVISGHGTDDTEQEVRACGANGYLEKPIDIMRLATIIGDIEGCA